MTDLASILTVHFTAGTPPAALYIGLVDETGFTGVNPLTDTMGSHAGWTEFEDYDEATRQEWIPGAVVDAYPSTVTNPDKAVFTPNVDGSIIGFFLCDNSTKGGTTGQLYGPWFFEGGTAEAVDGQPFKVQLTIELKNNTSVAS